MEKVWKYIKKHRFDILVGISVFALAADLLFKIHVLSFSIIGLYVLGYVEDAKRTRPNIEEKTELSRRGLTTVDLDNIKFVKRWEKTRAKGMVRYVFVYGGLSFGFLLCFIFSFASLYLGKGFIEYIKHDPAHMFDFIGYTYAGGFIMAALLFRFVWAYNERKFISLTDPLH